jgi:hypothetical protein
MVTGTKAIQYAISYPFPLGQVTPRGTRGQSRGRALTRKLKLTHTLLFKALPPYGLEYVVCPFNHRFSSGFIASKKTKLKIVRIHPVRRSALATNLSPPAETTTQGP